MSTNGPVHGRLPTYTLTMGLAKLLTDIATTPVRIGLAAAGAGVEVANATLDIAKRSLGDITVPSPKDSVVHILGLDETVERANRLAELIDEDAPLGRALSTGGTIDRLMQPGGLIDRLIAPDGVLERLTAGGGAVDRALAPGGLVDQLLAEDGLVERILAEDGLADRLLAEGGLIDRLTAKDGPVEQLTVVTESLNRLAPGMEELAPTIDMLREAVVAMTMVVNPLSNIAERIPLPRRRWPLGLFGLDDEDHPEYNDHDKPNR